MTGTFPSVLVALRPSHAWAGGTDTYSKRATAQISRFEVLSIDRVQLPADVAARLGVSAEARSVQRRENAFYADDDPVNHVTTCIPWDIANGTGLLKDEMLHQFGIHGILEEQHHKMTRLREEVSTRMPRPEETRLLRLRSGVPVLNMRGDMTGLLYDVPVE